MSPIKFVIHQLAHPPASQLANHRRERQTSHNNRRRLISCLILAVAAAICWLPTDVLADSVIGADNFSYPSGPLNGQTGGTGWVYGDTVGMAPTNWYDIYGNAPQVGPSGVVTSGGAAGRYFGDNGAASAVQGTGAIYFGVTMTLNSAAAASSIDYSAISALDYGTERIQFGRSYNSTTYDIGVTTNPQPGGTGPASGTVADTGVSTSALPTVRLVGTIQYPSGPNNGVLKLWVNPTTSDFDTVGGSTNTGGSRNTSALAVLSYGNTNYWTNAVRLASGADAPTTWSNVVVSDNFAQAAGGSLPTAKAIDILPLGDSITWGQNYAGGYETRLFQDLKGDAYLPHFLGSQANNPSSVLNSYGEGRQEGHPGAFTDHIYNNLDGYDNSNPYSSNNGGYWLTSNSVGDPDYILLMVGTNDIGFGQGAAHALTELGAIIDKLSDLRPDAQILVSNLLPRTDSAAVNTAISTQFNPFVPGLVDQKAALGDHVTFVNLHDVIDPYTQLSDGVHPNASGYNALGDAWFKAIQSLQVPEVPEPSSLAMTCMAAYTFGLVRRRRRAVARYRRF
jgi:lysophospholipase L1-like esterase